MLESLEGDESEARPVISCDRQGISSQTEADYESPCFKLPERSVLIRIFSGCLALIIFGAVFESPLPLSRREHSCLSVVILVCILWITEAMPLWVTALSIPLLTAVFQDTSSTSKLAKSQLAQLMSSNVILLMGGFTIASALHKHGIDARVAKAIQGSVGEGSPKLFILTNMAVAFLLSMFCNNVAAGLVTFTLIKPVIQRSECPEYSRCFLMSIAFACNLGGMVTPIASPQNATALKIIGDIDGGELSFVAWIMVALPISFPLLLLCWSWLLFWWRPNMQVISSLYAPVPTSDASDASTKTACFVTQIVVSLVSLAAVLLLCFFDFVKQTFGTMGIIGLIPIICFYGTGILDREDFKALDWGLLMLVGGGGALGEAVESSHLLDSFGQLLQATFDAYSVSVYWQYVYFCTAILIIANFISHTVAAITLLGVAGEVGRSAGLAAPFVLGGVLCDSGACALPVSSFPNMLAYGVADKHGTRYLSPTDFVIPALVMELCCLLLVSSGGWALAREFT